MEIKISEERMQEELNKSADAAVSEAFSDYSVRQAMKEQLAGRVVGEALHDAIGKAMSSLDVENMAGRLAELIQDTVINGVTQLLETQVVELVFRLEGHESYMEDTKKRAAKDLIRRRIRGEPDPEPSAVDGDEARWRDAAPGVPSPLPPILIRPSSPPTTSYPENGTT